jgi:hypothetical protein
MLPGTKAGLYAHFDRPSGSDRRPLLPRINKQLAAAAFLKVVVPRGGRLPQTAIHSSGTTFAPPASNAAHIWASRAETWHVLRNLFAW